MSWTAAQLADQSRKVVIVTGANNGIGFHTARELAAHGAEVVLACRNVELGEAAAAQMSGSTRVEQLDLASQASIAEFAARWSGRVDLLINNAGVMRPPRHRTTEDGHELMFGTNHLGHFALTARLLPALLEAEHPRVVTVASLAHHGGDADVLAANPPETFHPEKHYGQTKLANILFALELDRRARAAESRLESVAAHPGIAATNLVSSPDGMGANPLYRFIGRLVLPFVFQPAAAGADPTLYAATVAEPGTYSGPQKKHEQRGPAGPAKLSAFAKDPELAARLWALGEEATGLTFAF